jgi:hypothetical protein
MQIFNIRQANLLVVRNLNTYLTQFNLGSHFVNNIRLLKLQTKNINLFKLIT